MYCVKAFKAKEPGRTYVLKGGLKTHTAASAYIGYHGYRLAGRYGFTSFTPAAER